MAINFKELIKSKLPDAHAWQSFSADKKGGIFFAAGEILKDFNAYVDSLFDGVKLKNTTAIKEYINEYNIDTNGLTNQEILNLVKSLQVAIGGQSRDYIEYVIRASGFPQIAVLENLPNIYYLQGNSNVLGNNFCTVGNFTLSSVEFNSIGAANPSVWFQKTGVDGYSTLGNTLATVGNFTLGSGIQKGYVVTDTLEFATSSTDPNTWSLYFILTDKDNYNKPLNLNQNQLNLLKNILLKVKPARTVAVINR